MWKELLTIEKEFKKLSTSEKIYLLIFLTSLAIFISGFGVLGFFL
jgi:hypothetical protein